MAPTLDEQIDIWRYAYARSAMNEAKATIHALVTNKSVDFTIRRGLIYAFIVCYARPFTKWRVPPNKHLAPLEGAPAVPGHLQATHKDYLELRDKVVGHKDATVTPGRKGHPNVVHLRLHAGGIEMYTTEFDVDEKTLMELMELTEYFLAYCEAQIRPLMEKIKPELKAFGPGSYDLSPAEPPAPWIRQVRPLGTLPASGP
jgi:hypothetical protein